MRSNGEESWIFFSISIIVFISVLKEKGKWSPRSRHKIKERPKEGKSTQSRRKCKRSDSHKGMAYTIQPSYEWLQMPHEMIQKGVSSYRATLFVYYAPTTREQTTLSKRQCGFNTFNGRT